MAYKRNSIQSSLFKAIVLSGGIAIILFIRSRVGDIVQFSETILDGGDESGVALFDDGINYSEEQQEMKKQEFHGFWTYSGMLSNGVHYSDTIEIKENGIIWQYETSIFTLPYNEKDTLRRINTSYLLPYQSSDSTMDASRCYLKLIRQNWIHSEGICYGKSQEILENMFSGKAEQSDIIDNWVVSRTTDSTLSINNRMYHRYSGDMYDFFSPKAVEAIESIDNVAVPPCSGSDPHLQWVRTAIIEAIASQELEPSLIPLEQKQNLKKFYIPYCLNRLPISYGAAAGSSLEITVTVAPTGAITTVHLSGEAVQRSSRIAEIITEEMLQWRVHGTGTETTTTVSTVIPD